MSVILEISKGLQIKESIDEGSKSISKVFSSNQSIEDRFDSLVQVVFYTLFVATSLITFPLSLAHRLLVVIKKPQDSLSFNKVINLYAKDETIDDVKSLMQKTYTTIYSLKHACKDTFKQEKGIRNRCEICVLTVAEELAKPVLPLAYFITLLSLGVFHTIGSLFSRKCDSNKGIYVVNSIQILALSTSQLIFMPSFTVLKLVKTFMNNNASFNVKG